MRRLIVISSIFACSGLLAGLAFAVDGPDESELAEPSESDTVRLRREIKRRGL